jgi:hypothetical protein
MAMSEISRLDFLVGGWKGRSKNQFGEKGILDSTLECTREPSEQFLQLRGESRKDGKLLNRSIEFITYDARIRRYVSKRMWSMGFIENGVGGWKDRDTLVFQIKFDNQPKYFAGTLWRSFIRRYSENEIGHGLYTAKQGGRYRLYGETKETRVPT